MPPDKPPKTSAPDASAADGGSAGAATSAVLPQSVMPDDVYFRERTLLVEIEQKSSESHDKEILRLSIAALGVSIVFLDKIAPHPQPGSIYLLFLAWVFFVASIGLTIRSFLLTQEACQRQRELYDEERLTRKIPPQSNRPRDNAIRCTRRANKNFLAGMILLLVFSGVNMFSYGGGTIAPSRAPAESQAPQEREKSDGKSKGTETAAPAAAAEETSPATSPGDTTGNAPAT